MQPRVLLRAEESEPEPKGDDGKALDGSSPVGLVGQLVLSIAVLPYVALAIYSSLQLATTGQAFEPFLQNNALTTTGVVGIGEGVSVVVVFGMVLWSVLSFVFRLGLGLPEGPLNILGLTQFLSYVAAALFAGATFLNGLGEENPVKGISFKTLTSSPEKLNVVAAKGAKLLDKAEKEVEKITAEPRAQLEEKLKEVEEQASTEFSKSPVAKYTPDVKIPGVTMPDVKVPNMPDIKLPDIKTPEFKAPDVKMPTFNMPTFKMPELKLPERKAPPGKEAAPTEAAEEVAETSKEASSDLFD